MTTQIGASACVILDESQSIILYSHAKARQCELDPEKKQRNNEQELGAIIRAVMCLPNGCEVIIFSDSQYSVNVLNGSWQASANLGLIDRFHEEVRKRHIRVTLRWVRGHDKSKWNNYADELCNRAANSLASGGPILLTSGENKALL